MQVVAVLRHSPHAIQRDLQRKKDAGRGDQQHDHREDPHLGMRKGQRAHVAHDELLVVGQEVAHHVADHLDMPLEWKTRCESVNSSTMNGKSERMTCAATEKA